MSDEDVVVMSPAFDSESVEAVLAKAQGQDQGSQDEDMIVENQGLHEDPTDYDADVFTLEEYCKSQTVRQGRSRVVDACDFQVRLALALLIFISSCVSLPVLLIPLMSTTLSVCVQRFWSICICMRCLMS